MYLLRCKRQWLTSSKQNQYIGTSQRSLHHNGNNVLHVTLDNSNALLYDLPKKTIKRYQVIQNIGAKLVLGRSKYSSSTEALKCLHWLPIQWRITYKIGLLTFKCINKVASRYPRSSSPSESQHEITCNQTPLAIYWKYQKSNIKQLLWDHSNMLHQKHGILSQNK